MASWAWQTMDALLDKDWGGQDIILPSMGVLQDWDVFSGGAVHITRTAYNTTHIS